MDNEKPDMRPRNKTPARGDEFVVESRLPPSPLWCYGGRGHPPAIAFGGGGCLDGLSQRLNATSIWFSMSWDVSAVEGI